MSKFAPIALFVYNRPEHTKKTVEALQKNEFAASTDLFVFSDAPRDDTAAGEVEAVREYAKSITGFASLTVVTRPHNLGLAESIIDGVSMLCERYGRAIVLEDDLLTSPYFLRFMNDGLDTWANDGRVLAICGYMYPVELDRSSRSFFLSAPHSWGWATWKDRWGLLERDGAKLLSRIEVTGLQGQFDSNGPYSFLRMLKDQISGRNDSWFIRWHASGFLNGKFSFYPAQSMVRNIGIDGSGVHCADWRIDPFAVELASHPIQLNGQDVVPHRRNQRALNRYFLKVRVARYLNFFYRKFAKRNVATNR